ncbi:MAG: DUF2070 family protein [Candidatus Nanohalobium sp.]
MGQNVDIFKKVVFTIPDFRKVAAVIIGLGAIYAALFTASTRLFSPYNPGIITAGVVAVFAFILPAFISGELLYRFLPDYPRSWGYFLAGSNETMLFIYGVILTGAESFGSAWRIFWLALATVYLSNLVVLLLTLGYKYIDRIAVLSSVQPLAFLAAFHYFLGGRINASLTGYIWNIAVLGLAAALLFAVIIIGEYLIKVNTDVSVVQLTTGLLQKKQEALDLGYPTRPEVQTLEIENREDSTTLLIPWIHPGPLEGFGGGQITSKIIEKLNKDGKGFFLHVPSMHKSDPTDPEDHRKILEAVEKPEKTGKASKMITEKYPGVTFHGRKIGENKVIYMDAEWDDYELPVFKEELDLDRTVLIDTHSHDTETDKGEVWYNTRESRQLRKHLTDFKQKLEQQRQHSYHAGTAARTGETPVFALVEKVAGQKTAVFGIEGNGTTRELRKLEEKLSQRYDQTVLFTTDTHQSIHELSSRKQVKTSKIQETVQKADENLSDAQIGMKCRKTPEINLLQEDYLGLVFTINILIRLTVLALILLYTGLVTWIYL